MRKYDIIYVDPPWEYKQPGSKKNSRGMAKQKYNTISRSGINNCLPSAMGMGGGHTPMVESKSLEAEIWLTSPRISLTTPGAEYP